MFRITKYFANISRQFVQMLCTYLVAVGVIIAVACIFMLGENGIHFPFPNFCVLVFSSYRELRRLALPDIQKLLDCMCSDGYYCYGVELYEHNAIGIIVNCEPVRKM